MLVAALVTAATLVGSLVVAAPASPTPAPVPPLNKARVVVLGPSQADVTVTRLRDELRLLGYEVVVREIGEAPEDLAQRAVSEGAAAVARVESWPPEILVWIDPRATSTGGGAPGQIRVSDSLTGQASPALLALRAVELLRGSLLPVPARSAFSADASATSAPPSAALPTATLPTPSAASPPLASSAPATSSRPAPTSAGPRGASAPSPEPREESEPWRGTVALGAGVLLSPGGVPAAPVLRLSGSLDLAWRLVVTPTVLFPTTAATVSGTHGEMGMRLWSFGAALGIELTPRDWAFGAEAGLGLSAAALTFSGEAAAPYEEASGTGWAAAPYAELGARFRFHPLLAIRLDTQAAMLLPEPVLRVAGEQVADFGRPAVTLAASLELTP